MADFSCIIWKVEHGSAAFLRTPNDRTVMFDAGSSEDFSPAKHLAIKGGIDSQKKRLDKIIISHADKDHITDLPEVLSSLNPRILHKNSSVPSDVVFPDGVENLNEPLLSYKKMVDKYTSELDTSDKATPLENWGGVSIEVFACSPDKLKDCPKDKIKNNTSLLALIKFGDLEIVFPGDLEPLGWDALLANTNLKDSVGKSKLRILVASHHGRKSGIRYKENGQEKVYDTFLKLIKPHLVIISDVWGNETTDPEAYRPYCSGCNVYFKADNKLEDTKILTTKTNQAVGIFVKDGNITVGAY